MEKSGILFWNRFKPQIQIILLAGFAMVTLFCSTTADANIEYYPDAEDHERTVKEIVAVCEGEEGRGVVPIKRKIHGTARKKRHQRKAAACPVRKPKHYVTRKSITLAETAAVVREPDCDAPLIIIKKDSQWSLKCFRKLLKGDLFEVDPLPPCFKVYVDEKGIPFQHFETGYEERLIPVVNLFTRTPGCYVACYSHNPDKAVYSVANNIYLIGHIRVRGNYEGKMCVPENYENSDIRGEKAFKELCSRSFSCIGNSCWAGGATGVWFGL